MLLASKRYYHEGKIFNFQKDCNSYKNLFPILENLLKRSMIRDVSRSRKERKEKKKEVEDVFHTATEETSLKLSTFKVQKTEQEKNSHFRTELLKIGARPTSPETLGVSTRGMPYSSC